MGFSHGQCSRSAWLSTLKRQIGLHCSCTVSQHALYARAHPATGASGLVTHYSSTYYLMRCPPPCSAIPWAFAVQKDPRRGARCNMECYTPGYVVRQPKYPRQPKPSPTKPPFPISAFFCRFSHADRPHVLHFPFFQLQFCYFSCVFCSVPGVDPHADLSRLNMRKIGMTGFVRDGIGCTHSSIGVA